MSTRKRCLVVVFLLLPVPARADRHKWDLAISPLSTAKRSYLKGAHLGGALTVWTEPKDDKCGEIPKACTGTRPYKCACIESGITYELPDKRAPHRWILALLGDIGHHWGQHEGADFTQTSAAGGLRLTFGRLRGEPFVHGIVGGLQSHTAGNINTDVLVGFGGGVDVVLWADTIIARLQADRFKVFSAGGGDTYPRYSLSFVYRFEPRH